MRRRILGLAGVLALLFVAWRTGLAENLDPVRLQQLVDAAGAWGPVVYLVLFWSLQAVGFPGVLFIGAAVAVWPFWTAFPLIWAGSIGAGCMGFVFARTIGRDFVRRHMPARLQRFDARLAAGGLRWVIGLRLLTYLAAPAHWVVGLSGVPFRTALLGSAIGFAPWSLLWTFMGRGVVTWIYEQPGEIWLGIAGLVALGVTGHQLWQRQRAAQEATPPA